MGLQRERAWLGRAHRHRQLPTDNGHWWSVCYVGWEGGGRSLLTDQSWEEKTISDFGETIFYEILKNLAKIAKFLLPNFYKNFAVLYCENFKLFAAKISF